MKKAITLLTMLSMMTMMIALTGCTSDNASEEKTVTVELEENATTGYTWSYTADNDGILKERKDDSIPGDSSNGLVGAPGKRIFTFEAVKDGTVTLTFEYSQDWEGGSQGRIYTETYEVKDGIPTLTATSGSKTSEADSAESEEDTFIQIENVSSTSDTICVKAKYMEVEESYDEEAPFIEIDGKVVDLTLSPDAKVLFSEDMGPQTEEISAADFVEKFTESSAVYLAVINGDTIESLEYVYRP